MGCTANHLALGYPCPCEIEQQLKATLDRSDVAQTQSTLQVCGKVEEVLADCDKVMQLLENCM
jgi:hypothetical protein